MKEPNKDEAEKADESEIVVESPSTEESEVEEEVVDQEIEETSEESTDEELPTDTEREEVDETLTEEESTEGTPKVEGRKTAESRIRRLVTEKKEAEAKAESLADQVRKMTTVRPPEYVPSPETANDTELTVEEVLRRADTLTQIRLAQQDNLHRVNNEALEAIKAYPELDPESESFDPDLSESISQATLASISANPTAPVRKFVDSMMKPYKKAVEKQATGQAEALTKQASQTAMRPTQVQEQEKPFSELSIEEMEKKLGVVNR